MDFSLVQLPGGHAKDNLDRGTLDTATDKRSLFSTKESKFEAAKYKVDINTIGGQTFLVAKPVVNLDYTNVEIQNTLG